MKIFKVLFVVTLLLASCKAKYPALNNGLYADLQTEKGDILLNLYFKEVPMTVANFVSLAEGNNPKVTDSLKGKYFYDGLKFHRVVDKFMIQGGDITGTGSGNAGYRFDDEIPLDSKGEPLLKHDSSGILSMANSGPQTNSSQFFITHKKTPWLDGKHSVFGRVEIGQSVVDSIVKGDIINSVDIIRVGKVAKNFDAPKVFLEQLKISEERLAKEAARIKETKIRFKKAKDFDKAIKTTSGLSYLILEHGKGERVNHLRKTVVHYSLYNDMGDKIDSSYDRKKPFTCVIAKDKMIAGWKEGLKLLHKGDKARIFVPSHLAYGKVGRMPVIRPNTDLIFEIEVIEVK